MSSAAVVIGALRVKVFALGIRREYFLRGSKSAIIYFFPPFSMGVKGCSILEGLCHPGPQYCYFL